MFCGPAKHCVTLWSASLVFTWVGARPLIISHDRDLPRKNRSEEPLNAILMPSIQKRARKERAFIWWADQVGFHSKDQVGRTYGLRGHTPVIHVTDKRFNCNAAITMTHQGQIKFILYKETLRGPV